MNCKPGDLAIFVKSWSGNEGKIVRCLRINEWRSRLGAVLSNGQRFPPEPIWDIDQALPAEDGSIAAYAADSQLRPIRDPGDDAIDETLEWLPVPGKAVTA